MESNILNKTSRVFSFECTPNAGPSLNLGLKTSLIILCLPWETPRKMLKGIIVIF